MRTFFAAAVLLSAITPASAEPGDKYDYWKTSTTFVQHVGRSGRHAFQTMGEVVGRRSQACINAPGTHGYLTCGCELSIKLFGKIIPELKLAWNWAKKFARTSPGDGAVAVRPGHVLLVMAHVKANVYKVWDPNSGDGLTRIHERDLTGWVFVNPNSARVAMN